MIGSRKTPPPSSLLQELGKSNTVGGGLFGKKKIPNYLTKKYYWMETKIEYALSRPVRNEENIDKRRGVLSDHKEPKAVIAVIRYPNGDFDLRVNRLAKLDESSSFVNKYMGMIIPYYGWAKKKKNARDLVKSLNYIELQRSVWPKVLTSRSGVSDPEEFNLGDGEWDVFNDPNYAPPDSMKERIKELLQISEEREWNELEDELKRMEENEENELAELDTELADETKKMEEEEKKNLLNSYIGILENIGLKRYIKKNGKRKRTNVEQWKNGIKKLIKFLEERRKKAALKSVGLLKIRVKTENMEIFNNVIEDLFELYGFTMNEGDTKMGGYKLKRRSLKKYKKVVYMKDKTRRRYKRKYPKKNKSLFKKKRTKRRRVSGKPSSTRKNKYVLTYIRSLTRGRRKYN